MPPPSRSPDAASAHASGAAGPGTAALLTAAAFLLRAAQFGNPVIQVDEQFYTLVGSRMLRGALPYVDLWDRKPAGLFALYAIFHAIGGPGVLPYQIAATLFAAATAFVIARIAGRFADARGACLAGLLYLVWLMLLGGDGGQAPVFFNLPMAVAGWLALRAWERPDARTGSGAAATLLAGIAIQIKYTAVFEGAFFGLALLAAAARRAGVRPPALAGKALVWVACGLAPTLCAFALYAALGHAGLFASANFQSIFERVEPDRGAALARLLLIALLVAPLAILGGFGLRSAAPSAPRVTAFVRGWCTAATAALLLFGSWYDHYALPPLVPLAVAGAPALAARPRGSRIAAGLLAAGLATGVLIVGGNVRARGDGTQARALAQAITPRLAGGGTLYVFYGDPILYDMTGAPLPTRFVFPSHLNHRKERDALGVDRDAELRRVLAMRPRLIVTATPLPRAVDPRAAAIVAGALARGYRLVAAVPLGRERSLLYEADGEG